MTPAIISASDAQKVIEAATRSAVVAGVSVSIAVCDCGGTLKAFHRMDDACLVSVDLAIAKARCAVAYERSTSQWRDMEHVPAVIRLGLSGVTAFAPVGGGVPLMSGGGFLIGAIGVSGTSEEGDVQIADDGAHATERVEDRQ